MSTDLGRILTIYLPLIKAMESWWSEIKIKLISIRITIIWLEKYIKHNIRNTKLRQTVEKRNDNNRTST